MAVKEFQQRDGETVIRREGVCKGCGQPIWWVRKPGGGWLPENEDGQNHFATCPKREIFRRGPVQQTLRAQ